MVEGLETENRRLIGFGVNGLGEDLHDESVESHVARYMELDDSDITDTEKLEVQQKKPKKIRDKSPEQDKRLAIISEKYRVRDLVIKVYRK